MRNLLLVLCLFTGCKEKVSFSEKIEKVIGDKKLEVGVALIDLKNGAMETYRGDTPYPLLSVYKYHVAAKILSEVDSGRLSLEQSIPLPALREDTYSPMREENKSSMRLDSILYFAVSLSDNNACDILLDLVGGPFAVDTYFKELGIEGTVIRSTEAELQSSWESQYANTATPKSMALALQKFYLREYLSGQVHDFLWGLMATSPTGKERIKKALPADANFAHKTGTSGTNQAGLTAATNDAGIIVFPDGRAYVLVIFIKDSMEKDTEQYIRKITEAVL
jgi:beta-lactamase class A